MPHRLRWIASPCSVPEDEDFQTPTYESYIFDSDAGTRTPGGVFVTLSLSNPLQTGKGFSYGSGGRQPGEETTVLLNAFNSGLGSDSAAGAVYDLWFGDTVNPLLVPLSLVPVSPRGL